MSSKAEALMTHAHLRSILNYDPDTGAFTWVSDLYRGIKRNVLYRPAGSRAGSIDRQTGYGQFNLTGYGKLLAHRVAWCWMTGEWPVGSIDHKNGDRGDNRWGNLRDVPPRVNAQNIKGPRDHNQLGVLGVYMEKRSGKFLARIRDAEGKQTRIGRYDSADEAGRAYLDAKRRLHAGCTI